MTVLWSLTVKFIVKVVTKRRLLCYGMNGTTDIEGYAILVTAIGQNPDLIIRLNFEN